MSEFKVGDFVKITGQENIAEIISIKGNDLEVVMGILKTIVKKNKVALTNPPLPTIADKSPVANAIDSIDIKDKMANFKFELDVRGKMKDEVMVELSSWADDAILLGINEARISHGRGSGVIKETVRSVLKKYNEVESLTDAEQHHGGEFVTIVRFKK